MTLLLLACRLASAQALDFDAAIRAAVQDGADARIVTAEAERAGAEARAYAAWNGNPQVAVERRPGETNLSVNVPVEIAGQPFVRASAARSQRAAADLRADAGRAAVGAAAGASYLDALRARALAGIAGDAVALADRLRAAAAARHKAGEASSVESALLAAEAARALDDALGARRDAEGASRRLAVLLGRDPDAAVTLADWPRVPDPPAIDPARVAAVTAADLDARAALARLHAEALGRIPTLNVSAGWTFEEAGPLYGAALEIPLFAPGIARIQAARAEADRAGAQAERTTLDTRAAVDDARAELAIAGQVAAAWAIPELTGDGASPLLAAAARRFEAGETALPQFVAERDLALRALRGAVDARWRLERARLALWELAGRLPVEESG
jgi:outer membrane protein TolC